MSGYETVRWDGATNNSETRIEWATCPEGKKVVGGGGYEFGGNAVAIAASGPFMRYTENDSWVVRAFESRPDGATNWHLAVVAVCANVG